MQGCATSLNFKIFVSVPSCRPKVRSVRGAGGATIGPPSAGRENKPVGRHFARPCTHPATMVGNVGMAGAAAGGPAACSLAGRASDG